MAKEPRLSALSLLKNSNIDEDIISEKFTEIEFDFFRKILINNTLKTCSVGRIFDGVASILGLIDVQTDPNQKQSPHNHQGMLCLKLELGYASERFHQTMLRLQCL